MRVTRKATRLAAGAVLAGALLAVAPAADATTSSGLTTVTTVPSGAACNQDSWQAGLVGAPVTMKAGAAAGAYLWRDGRGWHLRVTHPGKNTITFAGTIGADVPLTNRKLTNDRRVQVTTSEGDRAVNFKVQTAGQLDGLDFRTNCASRLYLWMTLNGKRLPVKAIRMGASGQSPLTNPFVVVREP